MLEFRLNNIPLIIDPGTSVVIVNRNPACFVKSLQNCAALGVTIPVNDHNRAHLDNPERFERYNPTSSRKYTGFEIRWGGALLIAGYLIVKYEGGKYTGWVQSELGALGEAQQEKFLTEMDWPTNQAFQHKTTYNDATDDYGILKVHNRNFWEGKGREAEVNLDYIDSDGEAQKRTESYSVIGSDFRKNYHNKVNNYSLANIQEGCVISPYLHLRYVIKESLRMNGFFINRNDMLLDYFLSLQSNLMLYHNFNIVDINWTATFVQFSDWTYTGDQGTPYDRNVILDKEWSVDNFNYADLLPRKSYKDFLLGLQNSHNYIFYFRTDGYVDIIDRNAIPNTTAIDLNKYFRGAWEIGEQHNVRLKFTPEYDGNDGKFSEESEDLSDRWQDFGEPVADMDELNAIVSPLFGELRLVEDLNKIYEYGWNVVVSEDVTHVEQQYDVVDWIFVSTGAQPYIDGTAEKEEEIKTAFSTTHYVYHSDVEGSTIIPLVVQKGNIAKMRSLWTDFTLRLIPASPLLHRRSLYWGGTNGLLKKRWEKWARFWKTRLEVSAEFQLPLNMVTHIQNNITNKFRTDKGEFIIEEMETEFGMHQIGTTKIKGYKI